LFRGGLGCPTRSGWFRCTGFFFAGAGANRLKFAGRLSTRSIIAICLSNVSRSSLAQASGLRLY
jgi:hypothetical protein